MAKVQLPFKGLHEGSMSPLDITDGREHMENLAAGNGVQFLVFSSTGKLPLLLLQQANKRDFSEKKCRYILQKLTTKHWLNVGVQDRRSFLAPWLNLKQRPQWAGWLFASNKKNNQYPSPTYGVRSEKPFSETFKVTWQHLEQHYLFSSTVSKG